jgi:hypothetical protein
VTESQLIQLSLIFDGYYPENANDKAEHFIYLLDDFLSALSNDRSFEDIIYFYAEDFRHLCYMSALIPSDFFESCCRAMDGNFDRIKAEAKFVLDNCYLDQEDVDDIISGLQNPSSDGSDSGFMGDFANFARNEQDLS